jgi:hypothetical protein
MKDEVFGDIEWTGDEWTTSVHVPQLQGFGDLVPLTEKERGDLPPAGKFTLTIDMGGVRRRPSDAQRAAWQKILARGKDACDDALDAMVAEYRLQRPMRAQYWKTLRGAKMLDQSLPAEVNRSVMKQLVTPLWFGVHAPDPTHGTVDVYLTLLATWWSEAINVYFRDGRATEVTALGYMHNRKLPWIEVPGFGILRRRAKARGGPWLAEATIAGFRDFAAIAVDRSTWDESYTRAKDPMSDLPWGASRGWVNVFVYTQDGEPPTARQAALFETVRDGRNAGPIAAGVIDALFDFYRQTLTDRRQTFLGQPRRSAPFGVKGFADLFGSLLARGDQQSPQSIAAAFEDFLDTSPARDLSKSQRRSLLDKLFPRLTEAAGLRSITELSEINIFPDLGPGRSIPIGFTFQGTWTGGKGVGLRWNDGKVEEVGQGETARPTT